MLVNILGKTVALFNKIQCCHTHKRMHTYACVSVCVFFYAGQDVNVFKSEHRGYLDLCICRWAYLLIFSLFTHHIIKKKKQLVNLIDSVRRQSIQYGGKKITGVTFPELTLTELTF